MPDKPPKHRLGPPPTKAATAASKFRSTKRWQGARAYIRAKHPLCSDPFGDHASTGRIVPASEVHHVIPLAAAPELATDPGNLMALCRACHEKIEAGGE